MARMGPRGAGELGAGPGRLLQGPDVLPPELAAEAGEGRDRGAVRGEARSPSPPSANHQLRDSKAHKKLPLAVCIRPVISLSSPACCF